MKTSTLHRPSLSVLVTCGLAAAALAAPAPAQALPAPVLPGAFGPAPSAALADTFALGLTRRQRTAASAVALATRLAGPAAPLPAGGQLTVTAQQMNLGAAQLPVGMAAQAAGTGDLYFELNDVVLFEDSEDPTAQVLLNGNLVINPITLSLCSSLDGSCDVTFRAEALSRAAAALEVSGNAAASYDKSLEPIVVPLTAFTVGAFTVQPLLGVSFGVEGSVGANTVTSTVEQLRIAGGVQLSGAGFEGLPVPPEVLGQFEAPVFTQSTGAEGGVSVTLGVYFVIVTAAGVPLGVPFVDGGAATALAFQPTLDPWWDLDLVLDVNAGYFTGDLIPAFDQKLVDQTIDLADAGGPFDPLYDAAASRWSRTFDLDDQGEEGTDVGLTADGDLLVVGNLAGAVNEPWVAKLAPGGDVVWERTLELNQAGLRPNVVFEAANGDVIVAGNRLTTGKPFLARFDPNGGHLWTRAFEGPEILGVGWDALETGDGTIVVAGSSELNDALHPAAFAFNPDGTQAWSTLIQYAEGNSGAFRAVELLGDGRLAFAGNADYDAEDDGIKFNSGIVSVLEADGTHAWTRMVGTPKVTDAFTGLAVAPDGGLMAVGNVDGEDHALWAAKLDLAGELEWSRCHGGESVEPGETPAENFVFDRSFDVVATAGGYLVTATTGLSNASDAQLFKLDTDGRPVWWKSFSGEDVDRFNAVEVTPSGEVIATGTTLSVLNDDDETGDQDLWMLRASVDGMLRFGDEVGLVGWNDRVAASDTADVTVDEPTITATALTLVITEITQTWVDTDLSSELISL